MILMVKVDAFDIKCIFMLERVKSFVLLLIALHIIVINALIIFQLLVQKCETVLSGILSHFRLYLHAMISDIRKRYYQCVVAEDDQSFIRFSGTKEMTLVAILFLAK